MIYWKDAARVPAATRLQPASWPHEERAVFYQSRAYELRDRVSEREKLLITSGYDWIVTGDMDKERETYQLWSTEYPRDYLPLQLLGETFWMYLGQPEKAVGLLNQAWQLEPKQPNSPRSLAYCYLALNPNAGSAETAGPRSGGDVRRLVSACRSLRGRCDARRQSDVGG